MCVVHDEDYVCSGALGGLPQDSGCPTIPPKAIFPHRGAFGQASREDATSLPRQPGRSESVPSTLLVGTDDSERLTMFLNEAIGIGTTGFG